jgi:hypothetical protein
MYNLRKRVAAARQDTAGTPKKKFKDLFKRWQNETPVKLNYKKREARSRNLPVVEKFKRFREEAAAEEVEEPESEVRVDLRGRQVESIGDLKSNEEYVKWSVGKNSNLDFILRKKNTLSAQSLRLKETNFDLQLAVRGLVKNLTLQGFMGSLWDVFENLFNNFLQQKDYEEICFHATHDELDGSLSSSIFELKAENRDSAISEIMSRINAWNESSRIGAAIRHIQISVTLLQRNLPGNGLQLLAIGDDNLRKKAFTQENFNGSILYVESTKNCFYIGIYLCLLYNGYQIRFNATNCKAEKKRLRDSMWKSFQLQGEELER